MTSLLITFAAAFAASALLTVAVRAVTQRWGIVDCPDGKRKLHRGPVSLWGGVAVYLAIVLGLVVAGFGSFGTGNELSELSAVLAIAAGIVCLCGCADDCWCLSSRLKLLLQIVSVLPIVAFGYSVDRIVAFGYPVELGWYGIPLTVAWLVGCINALNLLDGMDGLASTVGLVTAVMMGIIATSVGHPHVAVIALVTAAALAGFLVHNLPPAKIFLGDSGSMVIGLVIGVLGIQGAMKTSATLAITVPAVVMTLPMFDTVSAFLRRKLTGRRFDVADRGHIHHRLLERGMNQWQALCVIGSLCLVTGAAATAATILRNDALAWITALALVVLMIRMRIFGHHESALAVRALAWWLVGLAQRLGGPGPPLQLPSPERLARLSPEEAWRVLVDKVRVWNVSRLQLTRSARGKQVRRRDWTDPAAKAEEDCNWSIGVTFREDDGRCCRLQATGDESLESEIASSTGLTKVLRLFGSFFAGCADQAPELYLVGEGQIGSDADRRRRHRAA